MSAVTATVYSLQWCSGKFGIRGMLGSPIAFPFPPFLVTFPPFPSLALPSLPYPSLPFPPVLPPLPYP